MYTTGGISEIIGNGIIYTRVYKIKMCIPIFYKVLLVERNHIQNIKKWIRM